MESKIGPSGSGQVSGMSPGDFNQQTATVMVGETKLLQVADRLGISEDALMAANPNLNPESVLPGQQLNLPQELTLPTMPETPATGIADQAAPSNIKSMVGELNLGSQLRELQIKGMITGDLADIPAALFSDSLATAKAATPATPAIRLATLPAQLDAANVPKKIRDELMAQASNKSGTELTKFLDQADAALASKDAVGSLKSLVMQGRIDGYFESFDATYNINGRSVKATPHFRIGDRGFSGQPGRTSGDKVQDDLTNLIQKHVKWSPEMKAAVHNVAYGRPTSAQLKMVTEALIKSGQFKVAQKMHPDLSDSETIRMMQWDHGVGIDCAGYVQQAFMGVHGGGRADYGFKPRPGDENLASLKGNRHFSEVKPLDVKPGDLIILDPPQKDDVGHTVLVRDHHVAGSGELKSYADPDSFAKPGDKVHVYQVDASFSGGEDGSLQGGLQRKTWLFNETTSKWAQVNPDGKGGFKVEASTMNGPYNHPMNGIYHPKGE